MFGGFSQSHYSCGFLNGPASHAIVVFAAILAAFLWHPDCAYAAGEASLTAERLVLEETDSGMTLVLEGPIQATFDGNTLSADSAVVTLGEDLSSLDEAIVSIELTGNVTYSGADGADGRAGQAVYYARESRVVLAGAARFTRGSVTASASSVDYRIEGNLVNLSGNVTLSDGVASASAESAEYNLAERTGSLAGSVVVHYATEESLFDDEDVREIVMSAQALFVSVTDGEVKTPQGPQGGRTTIEAGDYGMSADSIAFRIGESGINSVDADGDVNVSGPQMQYLNADRLSLSTEENGDRILRAEGNVEFSVMRQTGTADSIQVNLTRGWSIRLLGASIEGTVDETTGSGDDSTEGGEDGTGQ